MSKTHIHRVDVHFGDCDPAGIVFFPNYSRWMDGRKGKMLPQLFDCQNRGSPIGQEPLGLGARQ